MMDQTNTEAPAPPAHERLERINDDLHPLRQLLEMPDVTMSRPQIMDAIRLAVVEVHNRYTRLAVEMRREAESHPLTFAALRAANDERARQWNGGNPTPLEFDMMELAGEVGEACNAAKKLSRLQRGMEGGVASKSQIAEELADVVISADLAASKMDIDLAMAVQVKFNDTSVKHGFPQRIG